MASHSSNLVWKIPWTEKPGRLQSMGSQRVVHDRVTSLSLFTFHQKAVKFGHSLRSVDQGQDPTLAAGSQTCTCFPFPASLPGPFPFSPLSLARPSHGWGFVAQGCLGCGVYILQGPGAVSSQQLQSPLLAMTAVDLEQTGLFCGF